MSRPTRGASLLLLAAIVALALNLRPAMAAVGPLLDLIEGATGMGSTAASLLTTLPVLMIGLGALSIRPLRSAAGRAARRPAGGAVDRRGLSDAGALDGYGRADRQRGGGRRRRRLDPGAGAGRYQTGLSGAVRHGHGAVHHRHHGRRGGRGGHGGGSGRGDRLGGDAGVVERSGLPRRPDLAGGVTRPGGRGAEPRRRDRGDRPGASLLAPRPGVAADPDHGAGHLGLYAGPGLAAALLHRPGRAQGHGRLSAQRHDRRRGHGRPAGVDDHRAVPGSTGADPDGPGSGPAGSGGAGHRAGQPGGSGGDGPRAGDRRHLPAQPDPGDGSDRRSRALGRPARLPFRAAATSSPACPRWPPACCAITWPT